METEVELRNKIHRLIENADESLLKKVDEFISDAANELNEWQKQKIANGIENIRSGNFSSSTDVRKKASECIK